MLFDSHMHCDYSTDAQMKFSEAIAMGSKLGIGIEITEHWDEDYPTNPKEFLFPIEEYFARNLPFRNEKVLLGIEIGMQKHVAAHNDELAGRYAFDYVLYSMHCMNGRDLYEPATYMNLSKQQAIEEFLVDTIANLKLHNNFDSFAHIDYMCRYMPYENKHLRWADAPELLTDVFQLLVVKEKAIEINTRRCDDPQVVAGLIELYKHFRQLGGRYATFGSDAHYKEHVGRRLNIAREIAEAADLVPVYFVNREMRKMRL